MSILKADILNFVNSRLKLAETNIDEEIKLVLSDLSDLHILKGQDTTKTLAATDLSLAYPADALGDEQAIVSLTIASAGTSERLWPLQPLPGGWQEYQRLMTNFSVSGRSQPYFYVCQNRLIYPYPPPHVDYDATIWYYKKHPENPDSIEFSDSFRRVIYFGSAFEVACGKKLIDYITIWGRRYEDEKEKQRIINQN